MNYPLILDKSIEDREDESGFLDFKFCDSCTSRHDINVLIN